jgi:hypothetical protein
MNALVRRRAALWVVPVLAIGAAISVVVSPLPSSVLIQCVVLGVVVGLLWLPRLELLSYVGIGLFAIGVLVITRASEALALLPPVPAWQPVLLAAAAASVIQAVPPTVRRVRQFGQRAQVPPKDGSV